MRSQYFEVFRNNAIDPDDDPAATLERIFKTEYKIKEQHYKKGEIIPYHTHAHSETIVLIRGSIRLIVEEEFVDLSAGEMIVIDPWAIHMCAFPAGSAEFHICYPKARK